MDFDDLFDQAFGDIFKSFGKMFRMGPRYKRKGKAKKKKEEEEDDWEDEESDEWEDMDKP